MQTRRKIFTMDDGMVMKEHVCADYVCATCGARASYCNYVGDLCLQVFAPHVGSCGAYVNNEKYSGYVSECKNCAHNRTDGRCELEPDAE